LSHGSYDEHIKRIENIRAVEKEIERPLAILADLQGPKIRITSTVTEEGLLYKKVRTLSCATVQMRALEKFCM